MRLQIWVCPDICYSSCCFDVGHYIYSIFSFSGGKRFPVPKKEEKFSSREFWMFVGALVFAISAVQIIIIMSIPVYNKILGVLNDIAALKHFLPQKQIAPPKDSKPIYNNFSGLFVAIFIGLFSGFVQYLRYKTSEWSKFFKSLVSAIIVAAILTVICSIQP